MSGLYKAVNSAYSDDTFKPMQRINRAEFAQLLLNLADATEYKMTEENTVAFDDVVTRPTFAEVVMNIVLGESAGKGMNINVGFTDVPGDAYAVGFVRDIGIMSGVRY